MRHRKIDGAVVIFKPNTSEYQTVALAAQANSFGFPGVIQQRFSNCVSRVASIL